MWLTSRTWLALAANVGDHLLEVGGRREVRVFGVLEHLFDSAEALGWARPQAGFEATPATARQIPL